MEHLDILKEYLKTLDEIQLCELLDISSEDIIEKFEDRIRSRKRFLETEMEILDSSTELGDGESLNFEDD